MQIKLRFASIFHLYLLINIIFELYISQQANLAAWLSSNQQYKKQKGPFYVAKMPILIGNNGTFTTQNGLF